MIRELEMPGFRRKAYANMFYVRTDSACLALVLLTEAAVRQALGIARWQQ